ncbi:hypothetical protein SC65A3_00073 [Psychrobacter sp. SC65A.3]|uniref:DUF3025 domain-containing protein n=1 Tax=unclassified Psychrobacter TaxID=196806 RepID=UPI0015E5EB25|nr:MULTISPECIES: DUF3025 domain-containing protein [unclassified Psychrobacter]MBA2058160.1 DUF3025 domain-containing protein [Psychrobacter sp. D2]WAI86632.1 hypothetical protein SC65A3_00073 [Psychrobacter sp. SC65A.3]
MTATDLPAKPYRNAASNASINNPSTCDSQLDDSFVVIDWQAPWLCHLNQLDYISHAITQLSGLKNDPAQTDKIENSPDIIAKVLNTALQQQADDLLQSLPQTKPALNNQSHTLRFVSQNALPEGEAYESFIGTTGNIPTRDNLHDLFNGSIWLTFPKTKALLNYYHMLEIEQQGIGASRGRVRDTITVFDENGAILVTAEPSIGEALVDFDWQKSLVEPREQWDKPKALNSASQAAVYIFGHALIEKLLQPRKALCAHSIVIYVTPDFFVLSLSERISHLDQKVADYMEALLSQPDVTPRKLSPLPILGVPHFWAENAKPNFYDDSQVFRSGRRQK